MTLTIFATVNCIEYTSMDHQRVPVKTRRRYTSSRRDEQARQTRAAIVDAAQLLLLRDGFAVTTVAAIAAAAEVSVETIYKTFGGKPGMVRAICERGLAGEGPIPAETRSDELQSREIDPRVIIRGWGRLATEVSPLVAPILLLLRAAAATDPDMRRLQSELDDRRLTRMLSNAGALAAAGHLRDGVDVDHAAEVMWTSAPLSSTSCSSSSVDGRSSGTARFSPTR